MKIKIGKYVSTHGIKGEIKLISDFSRKDLVFVKEFKIYIKENEYEIESYRKHKNYDMLKLVGINNINDIIDLRNSDVFIERNDIKTTFIDEDLIGNDLIIKNLKYKIKKIVDNNGQKLIMTDNNKMIPYVDEFIDKYDEVSRVLYMNVPEGLL